ncbi:hypothetical protein PAXINDRAFT_131583 [Paxillus involutus ATCC 200175]|nr:hypothetical protein PAXINDRAFT_131583 [Paxillus involutus ATCC 200175]
MSTTLPLFWKLSSASKKDRSDASVKLISTLEQFQVLHVPQTKSDGSDCEEGDGLDTLNSHDVSYSIRRLIRGLASPRESSRVGFSVALTELLSRIDTVTCEQVTTLIIDSTKRQGSMTGQEERDVLFARLFGLTAVVQSGLLVRQKPLPSSSSSNTPVSSLKTYKTVLAHLLEIGEAKSWLRESAWWTIGLAIDMAQSSSVSWKVEALSSTVEALYSKEKESLWSPEKIAVTLKLQPLTPNHDWDRTFAPVFKGHNIFSPLNLLPLGRILKESALDDEDSNANTGSWKPQLHFAWDIIFDRLLPPSGSKQPTQGSFREFFRIVVDESLFSPSSSPERKYWGFQVFKKALTRVSATELPMLFTKNLMRSWINHLSNKDRYLHKISIDVAKHIQSLVQESPALGFPLILQLTGVYGSGQFDKLTRTKTVESILTVMDSTGIKSYVLSLLDQVNSPKDTEEDSSAVDFRRTWIADQFAALIRNGSIPNSDDWIQIGSGSSSLGGWVLSFLAFFSVLSLGNILDVALRQDWTLRRTSRFSRLPSSPQRDWRRSDKRTNSKPLAISFLSSEILKGKVYLSQLTDSFLGFDEQRLSFFFNVLMCLDVLCVFVQLSKGSEGLGHPELSVGCNGGLPMSLITWCAKWRISETDPRTAWIALDSDFLCTTKSPLTIYQSRTIDVLVDVIIGFLEDASAFTRSVANESFSRVSSAVQGSTVDLILTQLERRDPSALVDDEDEEMHSDSGDSGSDEEDEDEDGDEESSSKEVSGDDSDSEEEDDEAADEVRQKIENALKTLATDVGKEDEDEDEELMDDEQMMAIDEHLAEIFRSRTSERKSKKDVDAQREATHFKNRVLDLVEIFVKKVPQSPLNVRLVLPLVELVTKSGMDERQLSDKASGILKGRLSKSKDVPTTVDRDEVETILREVHRRAQRSHSPDTLPVLSQGSLYLCKILTSLDAEDAAVRVYGESLDDYMSRKASQLAFSFFQDWARRFPTLGRRFRDKVLESSIKAVNLYRRCQAFQLLHIILSHPVKDEPPTSITSFQKALQKAVLDLVNSSIDDEPSLSPGQVKDLLKVVLLYVRQTRKVAEPATVEGWDPAAWKEFHSKLSSSNRFKSSPSVLSTCRQVESAVAPPKLAPEGKDGGKRKAESEGADPSKKPSRKKQKKGRS